MMLAAVTAVVGSLVIAGIAGPLHAGASASRPISPAEVTIDAPGDGASTSARSITVSGTVSPSPVDYNTSITVSVNGRLYEAIPERAAYGVAVALERGVNQIIATAEIEPPRDAQGEPVGVPEVAKSTPVTVTRTPEPGDETGTLDRATGYLVANRSRAVYWLCGEADDCTTDVRCVSLTRRRVDCPAGSTWTGENRCGIVITVRLRGEHLFFDSYRCRRRLMHRPRRLVKLPVWREGKRFRVNERGSEWLRWDLNRPNRYGVPRFDVNRDVFLP